MGGKGGGGDNIAAATAARDAEYDAYSHPGYFVHRQTGEVYDTNNKVVGHKDTMWPEAKPVEAPKLATPAPEPEAAPVPAPEPAPEPPPGPLGPAINPGGAITQPTGVNNQTAGEVLGGSILNPPAYWVGNTGRSGRGTGAGQGSLTTTK